MQICIVVDTTIIVKVIEAFSCAVCSFDIHHVQEKKEPYSIFHLQYTCSSFMIFGQKSSLVIQLYSRGSPLLTVWITYLVKYSHAKLWLNTAGVKLHFISQPVKCFILARSCLIILLSAQIFTTYIQNMHLRSILWINKSACAWLLWMTATRLASYEAVA